MPHQNTPIRRVLEHLENGLIGRRIDAHNRDDNGLFRHPNRAYVDAELRAALEIMRNMAGQHEPKRRSIEVEEKPSLSPLTGHPIKTWDVRVVGSNGEVETVCADGSRQEAARISRKWASLTGWPVRRLVRVEHTYHTTESAPMEDADD